MERPFSPCWENRLLVAFKRGFDIVVAGTFLVLLSPIFLILSLAVKLTSSGTVFYRWKVVGKKGRPFVGYKLRSMCTNADELKDQLENMNEMRGPVFKITDDPRVTKAGRWMRRYSLDEIPQLYSVLIRRYEPRCAPDHLWSVNIFISLNFKSKSSR